MTRPINRPATHGFHPIPKRFTVSRLRRPALQAPIHQQHHHVPGLCVHRREVERPPLESNRGNLRAVVQQHLQLLRAARRRRLEIHRIVILVPPVRVRPGIKQQQYRRQAAEADGRRQRQHLRAEVRVGSAFDQ